MMCFLFAHSFPSKALELADVLECLGEVQMEKNLYFKSVILILTHLPLSQNYAHTLFVFFYSSPSNALELADVLECLGEVQMEKNTYCKYENLILTHPSLAQIRYRYMLTSFLLLVCSLVSEQSARTRRRSGMPGRSSDGEQ